jgi:hypothetical protein
MPLAGEGPDTNLTDKPIAANRKLTLSLAWLLCALIAVNR